MSPATCMWEADAGRCSAINVDCWLQGEYDTGCSQLIVQDLLRAQCEAVIRQQSFQTRPAAEDNVEHAGSDA